MGYNKENYRRISEEFATKYRRAEESADARRQELHARLPEVAAIDRQLSLTGLELMRLSTTPDYEKGLAAIREKNTILQARRAHILRANGYPEDYSAVHYECELCGDTGYVGTRMCECMRRALIMAGYESSGLGSLIRTQTFDTFSLDYYKDRREAYDRMRFIRDELIRYTESFTGRGDTNLLLMGGTGLGKTHLSSAVAGALIRRGFDVFYTSAVALVGDFEYNRFGNNSYNAESGDIGHYFHADLLIIDDLGSELSNQFTVSLLYNIINTRLIEKKATVISTNLSQGEIRQRYWDRITSRLLGEYRPLVFTGTDVRAMKVMKG